MTERVGEKIQTADDPSGSIFLPNIETVEDYGRVRQQIIFGRGIYRAARLSANEIELLLCEIETRWAEVTT